jgi:hypothetical protein
VVKVNASTNIIYMLDKSWVENLMPREYEYLNHMLLDLGPKQVLVIVSIHVLLRTPMGYLLPEDMKDFPYQNDRTNRQWTPQYLFYLLLV